MEFPPVPEESKSQIDKAGDLVASDTDYIGGVAHARQLLNKWRACHLLPLREIADDLQERLSRLGIEATVSIRLKRLFRIVGKLRQFEGMKVTRMQDIGALRAVVSTLADVRKLEQDYADHPSAVSAEVVRKDDYIQSPKENGYRSLHIVFKYRGAEPSRYDGIRIELQIRTWRQHLWASAVEVTGLETGLQLKYDEGDPEWTDFFELAAELIARKEGCPRSEWYVDDDDVPLRNELIDTEQTVRALEKMRASIHRVSQTNVDVDTAHAQGRETVLLRLDLEKVNLSATFYSADEERQAMSDYADAEQLQTDAEENTSVVLVRINSVKLLRRAYPTFFLDMSEFADVLEQLLTAGPA